MKKSIALLSNSITMLLLAYSVVSYGFTVPAGLGIITCCISNIAITRCEVKK